MFDPRRGVAVVAACLVMVTIPFARPCTAAHIQEQALQNTVVTAEDERTVREIVTRMYEARVNKDVPTFASFWSSKSPRRIRPSYAANVVFPYHRLEAGAFTLSRIALKWGTLSARVTLTVTVTLQPNEKPIAERWIRSMQFVKDDDTWKVYSEAPAAEELALEMSRNPDDKSRRKLLEGESDLMTEELAFALERQGDTMFVLGNYKGATEIYDIESEIATKIGSTAALARSHLKRGQITQLQQATEKAAAHFRQALEGFTALGDRPRMANARMGLGSTWYMKDDQASREHYKAATEILETLPDKYVLANALHGYGNACFMAGDFGAALDGYRRSLALLNQAGSRNGVPALLQAVARVQKEQRDYDAAVESYAQSLADPGNLDGVTRVAGMTGLADVYRLQGRFEMALEQYGKALAEVQPRTDGPPLSTTAQQNVQSAMTIEADIGNVYLSEQQPAAALDHYQKSLALAQGLKDPQGIARALAGSGSAYFADMRYEPALEAYAASLALREKMKDPAAIAWTHAHIGLVQAALEQHEAALTSYKKAYDLSAELRNNAAVAVMQTLLATEHAELDQPDKALELAEQAAALARTIGSHDTLAQSRAVAARVLRAKGDRDGAERLLTEAIAAIEANRVRSGDEPRDDFFGDTRGPYKAMALLMAESGKADDALLFAERAQIGLVADLLAGNRALIVGAMTPAEQEEERRLNREARSLRVQADRESQRPTPDGARLEMLKASLSDVEQRRTAFAETIYTQHAALKLQRGIFPAASLDEIRALVPDSRTALVEFVAGEKQAMVIVVTRDAVASTRAPATAPVARRTLAAAAENGTVRVFVKTLDITFIALANRVRDFRLLIRERDKQVAKSARDLYDLLLSPVAEGLAAKSRLVIVPDGPLWSLPFQALQSPDNRFLIQRASVSYVPSLTVAALLSRQALAATQMPAAGRRVVTVANADAGTAATRLQLLNPKADLKAIPNVEQEARRLALLYGPKRVKVYAGGTTKTDGVRSDARESSLLHLATVFVPNVASPLRSPFVLGQKADGGVDVLEAFELMSGPLPPFGVVSRVQTERPAGDGRVPVGLAWSFFVGGACSAVLATWPDDSPGAVAVMTGLHRALARPATPAAAPGRALRQAILPMLATQYRHPFYWANYSVMGIH